MTQLMGAQHTIEEEAAARAALTESAAELAAAAAEQQARAAELEAQLDDLRASLEEVNPALNPQPPSLSVITQRLQHVQQLYGAAQTGRGVGRNTCPYDTKTVRQLSCTPSEAHRLLNY